MSQTENKMKVLKYFPYRTAFVGGNRITFPREVMREFEWKLARLIGKTPDNHVCYCVDLGNHEPAKYFMFHDFWMIIGDEIKEGKW